MVGKLRRDPLCKAVTCVTNVANIFESVATVNVAGALFCASSRVGGRTATMTRAVVECGLGLAHPLRHYELNGEACSKKCLRGGSIRGHYYANKSGAPFPLTSVTMQRTLDRYELVRLRENSCNPSIKHNRKPCDWQKTLRYNKLLFTRQLPPSLLELDADYDGEDYRRVL